MSEHSSRRWHRKTGESGRGPIPYGIASVARSFRLQWRITVSGKLELIVPVRAIELTARQTKTQPGFNDLGDFNLLAFIKNNAQELVTKIFLSPACQQPSFLKHFLRNTIKKIIIKENGRQLS